MSLISVTVMAMRKQIEKDKVVLKIEFLGGEI